MYFTENSQDESRCLCYRDYVKPIDVQSTAVHKVYKRINCLFEFNE